MKLEDMSLNDLITMKSIVKEKLKNKEQCLNFKRGRINPDEYIKEEKAFNDDKNHLILHRINQLIEDICDNCLS
jgi:hypothetical protein